MMNLDETMKLKNLKGFYSKRGPMKSGETDCYTGTICHVLQTFEKSNSNDASVDSCKEGSNAPQASSITKTSNPLSKADLAVLSMHICVITPTITTVLMPRFRNIFSRLVPSKAPQAAFTNMSSFG